MAVGKNVVSVFAGEADDNSFENFRKKPKTSTIKIEYSQKELELHSLYGKINSIRNSKKLDISKIESIYENIKLNYPDEWLLLLEIYELVFTENLNLKEKVMISLSGLKKDEKYKNLIINGLKLLK